MSTERPTRPASLYVLMACLVFQGLSGIVGGIGLVSDPSGEALRIPVSWLQGSPFTDYLIPGLILLIVLGIFPLVVLYGLWTRTPWAWPTALLVGVALIIWIGVEIFVIGYQSQPPFQLIYGLLGIIVVVLALLPHVRAYYSPAW